MMKEKPIHYRELIIAVSLGIILFVVGLINDFEISKALYNPNNVNGFGIAMTAIAPLPVYFTLSFFGTGLFLIGKEKLKKFTKGFAMIVGLLSVILGAYYAFAFVQEIVKTFPEAQNLKGAPILILGIAYILVFNLSFVLFAFFMKKRVDNALFLKLSVYLLIITVSALVIGFSIKYLWSRPRPYLVFANKDPKSVFHPWWQLNPFYFITQENKDAYQSFPSAHSLNAGISMFSLPSLALLTNNIKYKKKIIVASFYIGVIWTLISMFSRILCGMHFLTDVTGGYLVTLISGLIVTIIYRLKEKKIINGKC